MYNVYVGSENVGAGHCEAAAVVVMIHAADHFAGFAVEHVAATAERVRENELIADRDYVQGRRDRIGLPDELPVLGIQAPDKTILDCFDRLVVAADVNAAVLRRERA